MVAGNLELRGHPYGEAPAPDASDKSPRSPRVEIRLGTGVLRLGARGAKLMPVLLCRLPTYRLEGDHGHGKRIHYQLGDGSLLAAARRTAARTASIPEVKRDQAIIHGDRFQEVMIGVNLGLLECGADRVHDFSAAETPLAPFRQEWPHSISLSRQRPLNGAWWLRVEVGRHGLKSGRGLLITRSGSGR